MVSYVRSASFLSGIHNERTNSTDYQMTPQERAEKIWNSYMTKEQFFQYCTAQIEEAEREAVSKVPESRYEVDKEWHRKQGYELGFAAARERAVLIAKDYSDHSAACASIANRIGKMEPEK